MKAEHLLGFCFVKIFFTLPVGAIRTERFPKIGKDFTKDETKVVFPVPA